jgi:hypothetical protein
MATTTAQAVTAGWTFSANTTTVNGGQSPTTVLTVTSTAAFPTAGNAWVKETKFAYTGKTGTTFTGCTGLPGTVANLDVVFPDGLASYTAHHILNGAQVSQAAADPATLTSSIDGFRAYNATAAGGTTHNRGQKWFGETV